MPSQVDGTGNCSSSGTDWKEIHIHTPYQSYMREVKTILLTVRLRAVGFIRSITAVDLPITAITYEVRTLQVVTGETSTGCIERQEQYCHHSRI
jgi:hypothetical protein